MISLLLWLTVAVNALGTCIVIVKCTKAMDKNRIKGYVGVSAILFRIIYLMVHGAIVLTAAQQLS